MFYPFGVPGETVDHRVDRLLLSFFFSRRNWDIPTPSPAGECVSPLWLGGGGTLAKGRGGGVSLFERGDRHCGTLGINVLCAQDPEPVFLNINGAQESIPRNEFRQPM
jgi:hypothetical protein